MFDISILMTYVMIVAGFSALPGPAVLLTTARSVSSGTRAGIATSLGIATGDLLHTVLAVLGVSAILMASAVAFTIMKYVGAAYLIYLGVKAILGSNPSFEPPAERRVTPKMAFKQGVLCEALNPKSAMFFLAFLPQFVQTGSGSVSLQLSVLGLLFVAIGAAVTIGYACAAGRVGVFLRHSPMMVKWQNRIVGSLFCALGVHLALQKR
ncbi:LysE family translocator [Halomonas sp.]|uniref:LysE family translocator n=1 Tax=Halomonas sp. TaxID=1486246 RepID=UPI00298D9044|nr:LysE family translocator [Halomonas sp.]MDW7748208.1 LysE family translocator [Halomonas sp.]